METLRGVILDVDGTLVDSNNAHARAWVDALAESGYLVSRLQVLRRIGMGGDKILPNLVGIEEDSKQGQAISRRRQAIFRDRYLPHLGETRGAHDLLRFLHECGLRLVVASSAKKDELDRLLEVCGANGYIEGHTSSDDAANSKPDPDIINAALRRIGLPANQVVMLGDTPYDIQAARRASVATIALRSGGWTDDALHGAIAVYEDPADLLRRFPESPLANGCTSKD